MELELTAEDSSLARLVVRARGGDAHAGLTRASEGSPPTHAIGRSRSPRFKLAQPASPDDAMVLTTIESGALAHVERLAEDVAWRYLEWAEGAAAEGGGDLLAALPPGEYRLVRKAISRVRPERVLLGNERVLAPPNALLVLDEKASYAAAFGAHGPPSVGTPLVGLALLEMTGSANKDAVLFFELAEAPARAGDAVLVVPLSGVLVVDALASFRRRGAAGEGDEPLRAWAREGGEAFARHLAKA